MSAADYIILTVVAVCFFLSVYFARKRKGCCGSCDGCAKCGKCEMAAHPEK